MGQGPRGFDKGDLVQQRQRLERVFVRDRLTVQTSRVGASNSIIVGGAAVRFQMVYGATV
ncbi:MAG: hypothetical protein R3F31_08325 [Verrucomicrobiales bacterium]